VPKPDGDDLAPSPGIRLDKQQQIAWLRLIRSENVGPATFFDAINHFATTYAALEGLPELVAQGKSGKRIRITLRRDAEEERERLSRINGRLICFGEPDYPPALRAADAPPARSCAWQVRQMLSSATLLPFSARATRPSPVSNSPELSQKVSHKLVTQSPLVLRARSIRRLIRQAWMQALWPYSPVASTWSLSVREREAYLRDSRQRRTRDRNAVLLETKGVGFSPPQPYRCRHGSGFSRR